MIFLRKSEVLKMHAVALARFGGSGGVRDDGALESALVAAENRLHYENADIAACAATYAFHLTMAHAFVDGNKRVAAAACEVFLIINGAALEASDDDLYEVFMGIAKGEWTRERVEAWLRRRVR